MHGDPANAAQHLIPFGETFFGLRPDRHYFADALEKSGWKPGLGTTAAGTALDIVTDPSVWMGIGLLPGLGKNVVTAAGKKAGVVTGKRTVEEWSKHLADGSTKLFGGTVVPFGLDRLITSAPAMTWQSNLLPGKMGKNAAEWVSEHLAYGKVLGWPVQAMRRVFSPLPGIGRGDVSRIGSALEEAIPDITLGEKQRLLGNAYLNMKNNMEEIGGMEYAITRYGGMIDGLKGKVRETLENGNVIDAAAVENMVKLFGETYSSPGAIPGIVKQLDPDMFQGIPHRLALMRNLAKNPDSLSPVQRASALREQQGMQDLIEKSLYSGGAKQDAINAAMGYTDEVVDGETFRRSSLVESLSSHLDRLWTAKEKMRDLLRVNGIDVEDTAEFAGHFSRQIEGGKRAPGTLLSRGEFPFAVERKPFLRNILGVMRHPQTGEPVRNTHSTSLVNMLSRDPVLSSWGTDLGKAVNEAARKVKTTVPTEISGGSLIRLLGREGSEANALVLAQDSGGQGWWVREAGAQNSRLARPEEIGAVYDKTDAGYSRLQDLFQMDSVRGGARYDRSAARKRLFEHYGYKYSPSADDLVATQRLEPSLREMAITEQRSEELLDWLQKLPQPALENGFFDRNLIDSSVDYIRAGANALTAMEYTKSMIAHGANADGRGISLLEFIQRMYGKTADPAKIAPTYLEKMAQVGGGLTDEMGRSVSKGHPTVASVLKTAKDAAGSDEPLKIAERVFVPEPAVGLASRFADMHIDASEHVSSAKKMWRDIHDAFRAVTYSVWPASQNRNLFSGQVVNMMTGMFSRSHFYNIMKWWRAGGEEPLVIPGLTKALGEDGDLVKLAFAHRALDGTEAADIFNGNFGIPKRVKKGTVENLLMPVLGIGGTNPWRLAPGEAAGKSQTFAQEAGAALLGVGRTGDGKLALGQGNQSRLVSGGRALSSLVEFVNRMTGFATLLEKGYTPQSAAELVRAAHFDYKDLSNFDRGMRDFIPFYTWVRKNIPAQISRIAESASSPTSLAVRGSAGAQRGTQESGALPANLREATAFEAPFMKGPHGSRFAISLKQLFPWEDLHWFQTTGEGLGNIPGMTGRTAEKFIGMTSPAFISLYQAATGREAFSGQDLRDKRQWPTPSMDVNQALNTFFGRPLSFARDAYDLASQAVAGDGQALQNQAIKSLIKTSVGGIQTREFYPQEEQLKQQRELLEAFLQRQPGVGFFQRPFIRRPEEASPDTIQASQLLGRLVEALQEERQKRQPQALPR